MGKQWKAWRGNSPSCQLGLAALYYGCVQILFMPHRIDISVRYPNFSGNAKLSAEADYINLSVTFQCKVKEHGGGRWNS